MKRRGILAALAFAFALATIFASGCYVSVGDHHGYYGYGGYHEGYHGGYYGGYHGGYHGGYYGGYHGGGDGWGGGHRGHR